MSENGEEVTKLDTDTLTDNFIGRFMEYKSGGSRSHDLLTAHEQHVIGSACVSDTQQMEYVISNAIGLLINKCKDMLTENDDILECVTFFNLYMNNIFFNMIIPMLKNEPAKLTEEESNILRGNYTKEFDGLDMDVLGEHPTYDPYQDIY